VQHFPEPLPPAPENLPGPEERHERKNKEAGAKQL